VLKRSAICAVLLVSGLTLLANPVRGDEALSFAGRIKKTVNPNFDGDQFAEGTILRQMEDRYNNAFQADSPQTASFQQMFSSDNVGGILLRLQPDRPVKALQLESATFRLEKGEVDKVLFQLKADSQQAEFRVPATIVPAAALMAADRRLVLLTLAVGFDGGARSHAEMAAAHPAIAKHQMAYMATRLDMSLQNVMAGHGRNYLLCEKPWRLSLKSLAARDDLFSVRCRVDDAETTPAGITAAWRSRLGDDEKRWFRILNDFAVVHRLIRAVIDRHVVGFPEDEFVQLLKQLQPVYAKHKMTREQTEELHTLLTHS
jgi:hypothetical protein